MKPIIKVEHVSKRYRLGVRAEQFPTLRDALAGAARSPLRALRRGRGGDRAGEEFWALDDVSFEVTPGEVVGVIGRNGAGKSTLLKILSRITEPTRGRVDLYGRVASLLEVGTGFHPELSGRENVYLNGAILGMRKAEIDRKFDEIVAFAEVERFIETPVKRYSSGMYVRLAFAVAAHLEPEILIVDEVLAVGDASFQDKCLGKMEEVARGGRTVLYVSHNLASIQRLCTSVILLKEGRVSARGGTLDVTREYLQQGRTTAFGWTREEPAPASSKGVYFERVYLADESGREVEYVTTASALSVVTEYVVERRSRGLQLGVALMSDNGEQIFGTAPQDAGLPSPEEPGRYRAVVHMPPEMFLARTYSFKAMLYLVTPEMLDCVDSLRFNVQETASLSNAVPRTGLLALRCDWELGRVA
jgi:lipopolysaccharide transport system ATP-binding protein